jgi:hypothetical protein
MTRTRSPSVIRRYWERKAAGLCVKCGDPCDGETIYCERHHKLQRAKDIRYRRALALTSRTCEHCKGSGYLPKAQT